MGALRPLSNINITTSRCQVHLSLETELVAAFLGGLSALAGVQDGAYYNVVAVAAQDDVVVGMLAVCDGGKKFRPLAGTRGDS